MPVYTIEERWTAPLHRTDRVEASTPDAAMATLRRWMDGPFEDWADTKPRGDRPAATLAVWDSTMSRELLRVGPGDPVDTLTAALRDVLQFFPLPGEGSNDRFERVAEAFRRETGIMAPGKDVPAALNDSMTIEERRARYDAWVAEKVATGRALVGEAPAVKPVEAKIL